jgi:Ribbon-helix-helix protein, copG family
LARMKRLQISLEPELDRELARAAEAEGVSKAEIIRRELHDRFDERPMVKLPTANLGGLRPGVDLANGRVLRDLLDDLGE